MTPTEIRRAQWAEALAPLDGVRVFGNTTLVGRAKASGFDGLYTYDVVSWNGVALPAAVHAGARSGTPLRAVGRAGVRRAARDASRGRAAAARTGSTYDRMWKTAIKSKPDLVTVTSYNEWQEGTQIEPARVAVGKSSYDGAWGKSGVAAQRLVPRAPRCRWSSALRGVPNQ